MSNDVRIVVVLTDANPELLEEMNKTSPRARAERLRALATMGLSVSRAGLYPSVEAALLPTAERPALSAAAPAAKPKRQKPAPSPAPEPHSSNQRGTAQESAQDLPPESPADSPADFLAEETPATLEKKAKSPGFIRFLGNIG
ncbi:hypothetical protein [Pulveribacter sp.]|uniref:hypothetical protein n=1 Tax=Pulveribacter sp. TaxID=2678893 RepID=UPI0028AA43C6|nr:hypothetical protein [Pulveribacter sp.]